MLDFGPEGARGLTTRATIAATALAALVAALPAPGQLSLPDYGLIITVDCARPTWSAMGLRTIELGAGKD